MENLTQEEVQKHEQTLTSLKIKIKGLLVEKGLKYVNLLKEQIQNTENPKLFDEDISKQEALQVIERLTEAYEIHLKDTDPDKKAFGINSADWGRAF